MSDELEFACIEKVALEQATVTGPWSWDVRLDQLSPGSFHSKLQVIRSADLMLHEQQWQRSVEVRGTTSRFSIVIGANIAWQRSQVEWCGTILDNQCFACAAPGSEIDFKTPDRSHHAVLQVKPEVFVSALGEDAVDLLLAGKSFTCAAVNGQRLITALTGFIRMYANNTGLVNDPFVFRSQKSRLFKVLGDCIAGSNQNRQARSASTHKASVRDAIEYVESSNRPLTALELAGFVGVSQRTLEYVFREQLGMTPGVYLRTRRLNAAHRELLLADPADSTVTAIAMRWGFNHPGRFSQMHRELFDEAPSTALRRSRT